MMPVSSEYETVYDAETGLVYQGPVQARLPLAIAVKIILAVTLLHGLALFLLMAYFKAGDTVSLEPIDNDSPTTTFN